MTVATDPRKSGINAGMTLLAASAVPVSVTGTVNETTLATVTIPAGAMGLNGGLQIRTLWTVTNNANAKTLRVKFGSMLALQLQAAGATGAQALTCIRNRNSASSQVGFAPGSNGLGTTVLSTPSLGTENSATNVTLDITAQLGVGTDTATLESYEVWLLP
jgi:hypothetical protein